MIYKTGTSVSLFKRIVTTNSGITDEEFANQFQTINDSIFDMVPEPIDFFDHKAKDSIEIKLKEFKNSISSNQKFEINAEHVFEDNYKEVMKSLDV